VAEKTLDHASTGIGMFTHMHLRGKDMTFLALYPDGTKETLLTVPNYSFDWQLGYRWGKDQKKFPPGTRIQCVADYDNADFNPYNPASDEEVRDGPQTYHEMMYGFFFYTEDNENLNLAVDPKTGYALEKPAPAEELSEQTTEVEVANDPIRREELRRRRNLVSAGLLLFLILIVVLSGLVFLDVLVVTLTLECPALSVASLNPHISKNELVVTRGVALAASPLPDTLAELGTISPLEAFSFVFIVGRIHCFELRCVCIHRCFWWCYCSGGFFSA